MVKMHALLAFMYWRICTIFYWKLLSSWKWISQRNPVTDLLKRLFCHFPCGRSKSCVFISIYPPPKRSQGENGDRKGNRFLFLRFCRPVHKPCPTLRAHPTASVLFFFIFFLFLLACTPFNPQNAYSFLHTPPWTMNPSPGAQEWSVQQEPGGGERAAMGQLCRVDRISRSFLDQSSRPDWIQYWQLQNPCHVCGFFSGIETAVHVFRMCSLRNLHCWWREKGELIRYIPKESGVLNLCVHGVKHLLYPKSKEEKNYPKPYYSSCPFLR